MSILVWAMMGIALWHFMVFLPQRFYGGIVGSFLIALGGSLLSGYLLPRPGVPTDNPPGLDAALWGIPGAILALWASYLYETRVRRNADADDLF